MVHAGDQRANIGYSNTSSSTTTPIAWWKPRTPSAMSHRDKRASENGSGATPSSDDDQDRSGRLLPLGKRAVLAHWFDRPLAAGMDDEEQPARHESAVPARHRRAWKPAVPARRAALLLVGGVSPTRRGRARSARRSRASRTSWSSISSSGTCSVTGGRNGVPPPTTTGSGNMRSSSTRPSSIAAAVKAGAADRDVLVGRVERRGDLLGHRRRGEPGVALNAVERAAEDDLRDRAPGCPRTRPGARCRASTDPSPTPASQHRLVEPAPAQIAGEVAHLRGVETKQLLAGGRPPERAVAVGDKAVD